MDDFKGQQYYTEPVLSVKLRYAERVDTMSRDGPSPNAGRLYHGDNRKAMCFKNRNLATGVNSVPW